MMQHVYDFGDGQAAGSTEQKNLLGGKGANLAEMTRLGLPVPPSQSLPRPVCASSQKVTACPSAKAQIREGLALRKADDAAWRSR